MLPPLHHIPTSRVSAAGLFVMVVAGLVVGGANPPAALAQVGGGSKASRQGGGTVATPRTAPRSTQPTGQGPRTTTTGNGANASPTGTSPRRIAAEPTRAGARSGAIRQTSGAVSSDEGVVLAGGAMASPDCGRCGLKDCRKCRPVGGRRALPCNGLCSQGGCPAHCPVRPEQFGYYATRWRSWPGQNVKQVGHFDPATTPVVPPRSDVPGMEDELTLPNQAEEPVPEDDEEAADGEPMPDPAAKGDTTPSEETVTDPSDAAGQKAAADGAEDEAETTGDDGAETSSTIDDVPDRARATLNPAPAPPAAVSRDAAWSRWSHGGMAGATSVGNAVRPVRAPGATEVDRAAGEQGEPSRLRSPAQKLVEPNPQAVGRWRAKAAGGVPEAEAASNPLRGVTAQPGNPLR